MDIIILRRRWQQFVFDLFLFYRTSQNSIFPAIFITRKGKSQKQQFQIAYRKSSSSVLKIWSDKVSEKIRKNNQGQPLKDYCYGFVLMCDGDGAQNAVTELKQNGSLGNTWTVAFSKDKNDENVGNGYQKFEKIRKQNKSREKQRKDKTQAKKKIKSESSSSSDSFIARSNTKQKKQKEKKQSSSSESSSSKFPTRSALVKTESKSNDNNIFDMVFSSESQLHPIQPQSQYQIKHIVHVRELFISDIPSSKTQSDIQRIFSHYGIIERIDIIPKQLANFAYVKFKKLEAVNQAILNQQFIIEQLDGAGQVKIQLSDPFKRTQIVGNAEDCEKDEDMLPVLFIGFPPNQKFTINQKFLKKMAHKYGGYVKGVKLFLPSLPQLRSYVLIEFSQLRDCKKAKRKFCRYKTQILGNKKCDVAILSNYQNNLQNKKQTPPYIQYETDYISANTQMPMHLIHRPFQTQFTMMQPYSNQTMHQQQLFQQSHYEDYHQISIMYPQQKQNQQQIMYIKTQPQLSLSTQSSIQQQFRSHQQYQINPYQQQINFQSSNQIYTQQQFMDMIMPPPYQIKHEDTNTTFWSGYMNRGKQHRVGIDARIYNTAINRIKINLPCNLDMRYLCSYQDAYQKTAQDQSAILIISPAQESEFTKFTEYVQYLRNKQRAGVIQTELFFIYVIPPGVLEAQQICHINQKEMIAIYCNKDIKLGEMTKKYKHIFYYYCINIQNFILQLFVPFLFIFFIQQKFNFLLATIIEYPNYVQIF